MSLKDKRKERQEALDQLNVVRRARNEKKREEKELRQRVVKLRERREDQIAGSDRDEALADRIDHCVAQIKRLDKREQELRARAGELSAKAKELGHSIKEIVKKRRKKRYYASPNFKYEEFDCNDGTPVPKAAYPAIRALCRDVLEPLRARYGTVHINSGYRHEAYNRAIGGAVNSIHIYDFHPDAVAADHTSEGALPSTVANFEEPLADGLGRYNTFVHADNRCRIGWPKSRWYG